MKDSSTERRAAGPIAWMANNPVASNLLMVVVLAGGLLGVMSVKQEVFPEFDLDAVLITVPYPGASPGEVEQGIVLAVEEAVSGIDGVKRVRSSSAEGVATITVELLLSADPESVLTDVTTEVDRITTFPEEAEEPRVALGSLRSQVVSLVIAGEQDDRTLHELAERARAELLLREDITQVEVEGVRPLEVSIEVPQQALEAHGLTLDEIARQVGSASVELPGGGLDTRGGEVLVRTADRRRTAEEISSIVLRGTTDGARLRLGDIATINDGFADTDQASYYNGQPAVRVTAYRVGEETPASVAAAVRDYADELRGELPPAVTLAIWNDDSELLTARIDLLVRNAWIGFLLVLVVLALFLKARLAAWVALGIPISFLGAFALMPVFGLSVNMVTLFALIVTLGLVVDDAIIVGENIHKKVEAGLPRKRAAIEGAREMSKPVTFSILTTVAAFGPLFFVPGVSGKIFLLIPAVVVSVLLFSWIESFFVLPAHLAHGRPRKPSRLGAALDVLPNAVGRAFDWQQRNLFKPAVEGAIRFRYGAVGLAVALLVVTASLLASGVVPFSFFPSIEGDLVTASARLPYGAPVERTEEVRRQLETSARRAIEASGGEAAVLRGMFTRVGEGPITGGPSPGGEVGSHLVTVELALTPAADRDTTANELAASWGEATDGIPGVESLVFSSALGPGAGAAVDVQLTHPDAEVLAGASEELALALRSYEQLRDVQSSWSAGKAQLDFRIRPEGRDLGLTSQDVARQLRSAFYGAEALREQRGRNELKVMVRLPEGERRSEHDLDAFLVRTTAGAFVPLGEVASFDRGRAPTSISREGGRRVVDVSAELAAGVDSPREVLASLSSDVLPELRQSYPGLGTAFVGEQREQGETFASLGQTYLFALFVIFALLAIPLRSVLQPLVIMAAIPLGVVGAVAGHLVMGYGLSIISVFGIIALSGVVVNDTLVLVVAANRERAAGASARQSIIAGATSRFRPIVLTSLTTFFGLAPMIFETSVQARFLVPMAISLGFGVLFATFVALLLVPALFMIVEDARALVASRQPVEDEGSAPAPAGQVPAVAATPPAAVPASGALTCPPVC